MSKRTLRSKAYMVLEKIKVYLKENLSKKRYEHTCRVTEVAEQLALVHEVDLEKVKCAALGHDLAKDFTQKQLKAKITKYNLPKELLEHHYELWHGPVAA